MLVVVIVVQTMPMSVVHIVNMVFVRDTFVTAILPMFMLCHRVLGAQVLDVHIGSPEIAEYE